MEPAVIIGGLAKASAPGALALLRRVGRDQYDKFVSTYTNVFSDHVRTTQAKCSAVKSLLHRDEALSLLDQYVNLTLHISSGTVPDLHLVRRIIDGPAGFIISGLAGSGKSMLMKWLAIQLTNKVELSTRIPIYIETREIPEDRLGLPLDQLVFQQSSSDDSKATFNQFHVGLTHGMFVVLMDGLDEVPIRFRDAILREVSDFQRRFPNASIICSTRPSRAIEASAGLTVAHVQPMSLEQITRVVQNAVFEEEKKIGFITKLESGLYENHKSFLSNPLLAIIMLITFDLSIDVPSRLSLFYSQVFEALFYKHDSSKGVYTREHYAKLEIDRFEAVLRAFCFQSYAQSKLSFEMSDLTLYIRRSLAQAKVETAAPSDYIRDCLQSLSLLQEDGPYISFVHRSFQEYFTARFLLFYVGDHFGKLIDGIAERAILDSVLQMLCEMNGDIVLRGWVLPKMDEIVSKLNVVDYSKPSSIVTALGRYTTEISVDCETGEIDAWTLASGGKGKRSGGGYVLVAIGRVLNWTNTDIKLPLFNGTLLDNWVDPETNEGKGRLPAKLQDAQVSELDGRRVVEVQLDEESPAWIGNTNLPKLLKDFHERLLSARDALNKRFDVSDDFTAELVELFKEG